jgi:hypothetical protein
MATVFVTRNTTDRVMESLSVSESSGDLLYFSAPGVLAAAGGSTGSPLPEIYSSIVGIPPGGSSASSGDLVTVDGGLSVDLSVHDAYAGGLKQILTELDALGGDVSGTFGATSVDKIRGYEVQDQAPADGDALIWVDVNSRYEPGPPGSSALSRVRAYLNSSQLITNLVLTTIQFANETFDELGDFDTGTYRFTAPADGYYHVEVTLYLPAQDANWFCYIDHNGTGVTEISAFSTSDGASTMHFDDTISMTSGQYLEVQVLQFSGFDWYIGGGENRTFFNITQLP